MPGEHNLETLLRTMRPAIARGRIRLLHRGRGSAGDPLCAFREAEGWTLVLRRAEAERLGLPFTYPCRQITLTVHSSLEAVGLLAAVSRRTGGARDQRERRLGLLPRSPVRPD